MNNKKSATSSKDSRFKRAARNPAPFASLLTIALTGAAIFCFCCFLSCQKSGKEQKHLEADPQEKKNTSRPAENTAEDPVEFHFPGEENAVSASGGHSSDGESAVGPHPSDGENFVNLYVALRLATTGNPNHPERARESRKIIMEKYKMTWKDYRKNLETLKQHPEVWEAFQEAVLKKLDVLEKRHKGE